MEGVGEAALFEAFAERVEIPTFHRKDYVAPSAAERCTGVVDPSPKNESLPIGISSACSAQATSLFNPEHEFHVWICSGIGRSCDMSDAQADLGGRR
jgi:hypothetical protein